MILPEYIETQFGWALRQNYRAGVTRVRPVTNLARSGFFSYCIMLAHSGHLEVGIGKRHWQLHGGSVLLLPPQTALCFQTRRAVQACKVTVVGFRMLLFGCIDLTSSFKKVTIWHPDRAQYQMLSTFAECLPGGPHRSLPANLLCEGATRSMVGLCWDALGAGEILDSLYPGIPAWLRFVMQHIRHYPGTNVNELARVAGYSLSQFHRHFERNIGMSPRMYLQQYRLDLAKHLLMATQMSITAIADQLGFASSSDFTRFFRRMCLETPSAFRNTRVLERLEGVE